MEKEKKKEKQLVVVRVAGSRHAASQERRYKAVAERTMDDRKCD